MMRRALLALALLLALTPAGCGGRGGVTGTVGGSGAKTGEGAIVSIEDLQATLKADYGDQTWFPDITGMTLETYLGAPVLAVHVSHSNSAADLETQNAHRAALIATLSALDIRVAPNVVLVDADGSIVRATSGGGGIPMAEAFPLPPAPTDAAGVKAWLDSVYGPDGLVKLGPNETWYASIRSVTVADPFGTGDMLIVSTDLPTFKGGQGSLVELAIHTTGSPLLVNYQIIVDDQSGPVGGVGGTPEGPGYNGLFYPAE